MAFILSKLAVVLDFADKQSFCFFLQDNNPFPDSGGPTSFFLSPRETSADRENNPNSRTVIHQPRQISIFQRCSAVFSEGTPFHTDTGP